MQESPRAWHICIVELKEVCTDLQKKAATPLNLQKEAAIEGADDQHTSKKACPQILVHVGP
jgi:hypothetical protein